jgi:Type II intron maturase/Reverse transcriptase (RNA-dependent DNA polymerase)
VENLLKAGYLERWNYHPTLSGTPQGGIVSPLLANIYLDRLDKYVEQTLIPEHTKGEHRRPNKDHFRIASRIYRLRKKGADRATLKPHQTEMRLYPYGDQFDPNYRRLRYVRYADDFLLGFVGPRDEAEEIKGRIGTFLREQLGLEMSPEKTLVTHAGTQKARFLGYDIGTNNSPLAQARGQTRLRMPIQKLDAKIAKYVHDGKIMHRPETLNESDFSIVALYGSEYRGIVAYYAFAENRCWLHRLHWIMRTSLLKTLANKHKTTVTKMARKYQSECYHRGRTLKCIEVKIERPDKKPLVARFGGLRLTPDPFLTIPDAPVDMDRKYSHRNELLARLLADKCELCGATENVEVHHVRKLADLKVRGRKERPIWIQVMSSRRRKTLIVCGVCHDAIHAGRPTRKPMDATPF